MTLTFQGQHSYISMRFDKRNTMASKLFHYLSLKVISMELFLPKTSILTIYYLCGLTCRRPVNIDDTLAKRATQELSIVFSAASYL